MGLSATTGPHQEILLGLKKKNIFIFRPCSVRMWVHKFPTQVAEPELYIGSMGVLTTGLQSQEFYLGTSGECWEYL